MTTASGRRRRRFASPSIWPDDWQDIGQDLPDHVRDGQFGKWLEGARDWSISRNRFWGSPIPIWRSDDPAYPRTDVYGSLEQIEADFGVRPSDLHRPVIDELVPLLEEGDIVIDGGNSLYADSQRRHRELAEHGDLPFQGSKLRSRRRRFQEGAAATIEAEVADERLRVRDYVATTRACKLYDFDDGRWYTYADAAA